LLSQTKPIHLSFFGANPSLSSYQDYFLYIIAVSLFFHSFVDLSFNFIIPPAAAATADRFLPFFLYNIIIIIISELFARVEDYVYIYGAWRAEANEGMKCRDLFAGESAR
jgi:hypothetical protein